MEGFDLERAITTGLLPPHFLSEAPDIDLRSYIGDYLKDEIAAEAVTRNLPAFGEFLRVVAVTNAELLNYQNIAREVGVSAKVVRGYLEILEDTLLGFRLHPWSRARTHRLVSTDKFYLFDVGVTNYLARRRPAPGTPEFGKSFEHYILTEILNYRRYAAPDLDVRFWRTASGLEVDVVLGDLDVAIEVKAGTRVHQGDLRGLEALRAERPVGKLLVVCQERQERTMDGVEILPWQVFVERLYSRDIIR